MLNFLGTVLLSASAALASDVHSPRTASLGGAGHAGPLLNDAIYLNPGFASFLPTYSLAGSFLSYRGPVITTADGNHEPHGRNTAFSVQDGRSDLFQAGVGYARRDDGSFLHAGASKSFIKRFGFGLGGKFFFNHDSYTTGRDAVFSTAGIASDWFQTSFTIDNIFETNAGKERGLHREFVLGTKFNVQSIVLVYFDPHLAPNSPSGSFGHESGLEFVVMQDLFLRLGTFRNSTIPHQGRRGRGYGFGAGWVAPRLSLDYGLQRIVEPQATTAHVFGATIFL